MATRERPRADREPLDETDVEQAIVDEATSDEAPVPELFAPSEPVPTETDEPTTEGLERELEDGTPGPEEQALHPEDTATEILEDERDAVDDDLQELGEELEWRMAAERDDDIDTGAPVIERGESSSFEVGEIEPDEAVRALMSTPVVSVEPNVSLVELAATLEAETVGAVPVVSGDHLEGVVSERDIVRALSAGGNPADVWAADVMADEPVYVDPDEPIITAAERMLDEGVRHVPVVSDGRVVGMVSVRDALHVLAEAWRRARASDRPQKGA